MIEDKFDLFNVTNQKKSNKDIEKKYQKYLIEKKYKSYRMLSFLFLAIYTFLVIEKYK